MNLFNESELLVAPVFGGLPGGEGFSVVLKGTYAFVDGGVAAPVTKRDRAPLAGEVAFSPASDVSARYPTDFAPWKPCADVLLLGTHHPDPRRRGARGEVTLSVGPLRKILALSPSEGPHAVLGFAPMAEASPARRASMGTFDERWLSSRWPYFPEDFDWRMHNAAPADQRVEGYLRGDERVRIEGLRPDASRLETTLPGVRPRVFVRRNGTSVSDAEELPLFLDTLWIDADAGVLVLVWRGTLATSKPRGEDVDALLVAVEARFHDPAPLASFQRPERWQRASRQPLAAAVPAPAVREVSPVAPREDASEAKEPSSDEEVEADPTDAEVLDELRGALEGSGVPPEILGVFQGVDSLEALSAKVAALLPPSADPTDPSALAADAETMRRSFLKESGIDLTELERAEADLAKADAEENAADEAAERGAEAFAEPAEPSPEAPSLDREAVRAKVAGRESLTGADLRGLDLSMLDLSGALFAKVNLEGVNLEGTRLVGADLSGANVSAARANGANFDGALVEGARLDAANFDGASLRKANLAAASGRAASFVGACFDGADCHGVDFRGANLEGASLETADFGDATLDGARLLAIKATSAMFRKASLLDVDASGADLSSANLTGSMVHRASFEGATLASTSFDAACGDDVSFNGANARKLRLGKGATFRRARFQSIDAERAVFSGANLEGSDFSAARLPSAAFRETLLEGATFHRAKLEGSDFTRAGLVGARLTKANMFQARLPEANLTGADCRMSNFFGAEFFRATVAGARFDGSNIGRTKLEGGLVR